VISHQYRCIFIHIPKTAGTSIEHKLGHFDRTKHGVQDHRTIRMLRPSYLLDASQWALRGELKPLGRCLRDLAAGRGFVTAEQYQRYLKFAFVRNPWARVYSWYKNVLRDPRHKTSLGVTNDCSLGEFVQHHLDDWALQPQLWWITDRHGKVVMDFIGKYETLHADFAQVCARLEIQDATLPSLITGDGSHYASHYDDTARKLVAQRYAAEIDLFGYRFAP
jgi:hypothetical protein